MSTDLYEQQSQTGGEDGNPWAGTYDQDDEDFITTLYTNVLAKTAEPAGRDYWLAQLTDFAIDGLTKSEARGRVIINLHSGAAAGVDKKYIDYRAAISEIMLTSSAAAAPDVAILRSVIAGQAGRDWVVADSLIRAAGVTPSAGQLPPGALAELACVHFVCNPYFYLIDDPASVTCIDPNNCLAGECCEPNPTCDAFAGCTVGLFHLIDNPATVQCTDSTCDANECCEPNPMCGAFSCNADYLPKPQMTTLVCSSGTCVNPDCCYLAPQCDSPPIICPGGTGYNKTDYANTHCTAEPCQELDCCHPVPDTCSTWDCAPMPGFLKLNPGSIICDNTCDNPQCCDADVQCSVNFGCDPGTHVIGNPTLHACAMATCIQSDCCESNAKCDDAIGM
jgi:hypothetical protein